MTRCQHKLNYLGINLKKNTKELKGEISVITLLRVIQKVMEIENTCYSVGLIKKY